MNSDVPFIITVKASNIYDNNDRYNIINNIKNKELINCLREHIVFKKYACRRLLLVLYVFKLFRAFK